MVIDHNNFALSVENIIDTILDSVPSTPIVVHTLTGKYIFPRDSWTFSRAVYNGKHALVVTSQTDVITIYTEHILAITSTIDMPVNEPIPLELDTSGLNPLHVYHDTEKLTSKDDYQWQSGHGLPAEVSSKVWLSVGGYAELYLVDGNMISSEFFIHYTPSGMPVVAVDPSAPELLNLFLTRSLDTYPQPSRTRDSSYLYMRFNHVKAIRWNCKAIYDTPMVLYNLSDEATVRGLNAIAGDMVCQLYDKTIVRIPYHVNTSMGAASIEVDGLQNIQVKAIAYGDLDNFGSRSGLKWYQIDKHYLTVRKA